jgi:hypothetical protein
MLGQRSAERRRAEADFPEKTRKYKLLGCATRLQQAL